MTTVMVLALCAWMLWVGWQIRLLRQALLAEHAARNAANNAAAADSAAIAELQFQFDQLEERLAAVKKSGDLDDLVRR